MEFKNVELRTRFRLALRWVMALFLGLIVQNTFAVETHVLNGLWKSSGGKEKNLPGNPYYVFTVESETEVNIGLGNSSVHCNADPYLYLFKMNGDVIEKNDDRAIEVVDVGDHTFKCITDSHIKRSLPAGVYLLQAATYFDNQDGKFEIAVSGSGISNFSSNRSADKYQKKLTGSWQLSRGRSHDNNPRYEFTVETKGFIDIGLESLNDDCSALQFHSDPFLYLLNEKGDELHSNDDDTRPSDQYLGGCGYNSYIHRKELEEGTYELVAATYYAGETGEFQISVSGFGISNLLRVNSEQKHKLQGSWDISAGKNTLLFGNPRYEFTVDPEMSHVEISLESSGSGQPCPYLYLLKKDDNVVDFSPIDISGTTECYKSEIETYLEKGKYQLVAATNEPYKSGDFVISIHGRGITGFKSNKYIKKRDFWVASAGQNRDHWANPQYKLTVTTDREVLIRLDTRADSDSTLPDPKLFLLPRNSEGKEIPVGTSDVMKKYEKLSENTVNTARSDYSFWGRAKGRNSVIRATLKAGEYKIVAATNELFESGDFVLSVGGLKEISGDNLEKIPHQGGQEKSIKGRWTGSQNDKVNNHENPHYKMELKNKSFVNIEFKNHENCGDPNSLNLYLLDSFGNLETVHGNNENRCVATIERVLDKGVYELIATNENNSIVEDFTLSIGGISKGKFDASLLEIKNYSGEWDKSAGKSLDKQGNPHYQFMVNEKSDVDIRLEDTSDSCVAGIDPYIILLGPDGSRYESSNLHNNFADKTKKRCAKVAHIHQKLPKGLYRLVAATEQANQSGDFVLSVSGSSVSEWSELHFETPKKQNIIKGVWKQLIGHNSEVFEDVPKQKPYFEDFSKKYTENFYALKILKSGIVTINLSSKEDTYLILLDKDKNILKSNDDIASDDRNSRLKDIHLDEGMYYLVATTYFADDKKSAKYEIELSSAPEVVRILYSGSTFDSSVIYGEWDGLIGRIGRNIESYEDFSQKHSDHFHTLKMLKSGTVTVDLISVEADTYLYLLDKDKKVKYKNSNLIPKGSKISGSDKDSRLENIYLDKGVYYLVATTHSVDDKKSADYMIKLSSLPGVGILFNPGSPSTMAYPNLDKEDDKYVVNSVDLKIKVESKIKSFEYIPNKYHISHKKEVSDSVEWKDLKSNDWLKVPKKKKMFSNTIDHTLDLRLENEFFYVHLMDTKGQTWTSPVFNVYINKDLLKGTEREAEMELENFDFDVKNSILTFKISNLDLDDLNAYFIEEFSSSGDLLASSGWKRLGMKKSRIDYKRIAKGEIRYVPHSEAATLKFTVKNSAGKLSYSNKQGTEQGIWTSIDLKRKNNTDDASDLKEKNNTDDAPTMTMPPRRKDDDSASHLDADGYIYRGNGDHASQPWACFRDNRTGLVWEVKTNDSESIHYKGKAFTRINNALVQAANKAGSESLCGFNDWREPSKEELLTLIDPVNVPSSIAFNESYFPNTGTHFYWTSESDLDGNGKVIDFGSGVEYIILYEDEYDYKFRKRLVRGAMAMPNNH